MSKPPADRSGPTLGPRAMRALKEAMVNDYGNTPQTTDRKALIRRTFMAPPDVVERAAKKLGIAIDSNERNQMIRYTQILEIVERSGQLENLAELVEADRVA